MRKARNNNNFIDKTFTIIADVILRVFPASQQEKKAFSYYLNGLSAQDEGEYAEALNNYYQALQIEEDLYDRSIILTALSVVPLLLVFFNAIFYSVHMSKTKLFSRWSTNIFAGFGFIIALDDDNNDVIIVIGCIGLTFRYKGLFSK